MTGNGEHTKYLWWSLGDGFLLPYPHLCIETIGPFMDNRDVIWFHHISSDFNITMDHPSPKARKKRNGRSHAPLEKLLPETSASSSSKWSLIKKTENMLCLILIYIYIIIYIYIYHYIYISLYIYIYHYISYLYMIFYTHSRH